MGLWKCMFWKQGGKRRNCSLCAFFPISTMFTKAVCMWERLINPFPHRHAFWRLCSRWLFENIVTKEEIAQIEQFLLLPVFPLLVISYPFNYRDFPLFYKIFSKSYAAELFYEGKSYKARFYMFLSRCFPISLLHVYIW